MLANEFDVIPRNCDLTLVLKQINLSNIYLCCVENRKKQSPMIHIFNQTSNKNFVF